jgi:hypothetical protein
MNARKTVKYSFQVRFDNGRGWTVLQTVDTESEASRLLKEYSEQDCYLALDILPKRVAKK